MKRSSMTTLMMQLMSIRGDIAMTVDFDLLIVYYTFVRLPRWLVSFCCGLWR